MNFLSWNGSPLSTLAKLFHRFSDFCGVSSLRWILPHLSEVFLFYTSAKLHLFCQPWVGSELKKMWGNLNCLAGRLVLIVFARIMSLKILSQPLPLHFVSPHHYFFFFNCASVGRRCLFSGRLRSGAYSDGLYWSSWF